MKKNLARKTKSESLAINRKRNQLPMPTLNRYPASDGIARSTIIHCTSVNSSSAKTRQNLADALDLRFLLRVFLHVRPSNKNSISLSLYSCFTSALGTRAPACYIVCFFWAKSSVPDSLSWRKPLSNLFVVPKLRSFNVRSLSSISIFLQLV